jgi:hypothetical protein
MAAFLSTYQTLIRRNSFIKVIIRSGSGRLVFSLKAFDVVNPSERDLKFFGYLFCRDVGGIGD